MLQRITRILTSYETPLRVCAMGNEAVARGAIEAGVCGVFAYPGAPSTEISEVFKHTSRFQYDPANKKSYPELIGRPLYFEYSVNERVALEKAIAYSIANKSALCCMKNVGMNVASDALMTITYQTIGGALVLVVCDDPGCHSSSNEQDSRYWGRMASVPVFNPATPADACAMTKDAFALSERIKLPVIVRMTTRVGHTRGVVRYERISSVEPVPRFERLREHINVPARTAAAHQVLIDKLQGDAIDSFHGKYNATSLPGDAATEPRSLGVIASGVAVAYALEIINRAPVEDADQGARVEVLQLGLIHPFPSTVVLEFLKRGIRKVLILEELDPIIENEVRVLAQKHGVDVEILGKEYAGLSVVGEYDLDIVGEALAGFTGRPKSTEQGLAAADCEPFLKELPPRPPALCSGCPHRATFYGLKLAVPRDDGRIILCGDIGCFGLGALPPLRMMDTVHHMGMSISMAQGLAQALQSGKEPGPVVALIGDGTFFHSGIPSLLNAVYTRANILVIIFDNRTIGMTGQQDHPGSEHQNGFESIELPALLEGMAVRHVKTIDPFDVKNCYETISEAIAYEGVAVVIAKSPCIFVCESRAGVQENRRITVDQALCNTCHNQEDSQLQCSKVVSAAHGLSRARAAMVARHHVPASQQLCPANICNHGFFNSILAGDYKEALEIVRDKMLFAMMCGDICHRPCEFLYGPQGGATVPIKRLKRFVSGIEKNFSDFSNQTARAARRAKQNKTVAVIGAGPAGLSAAYDLVRVGYDVTVYEKEKEAGGLLKFGIPSFRLGWEKCDTEITLIEELGVKFKFNMCLGKDFHIQELEDEYDAVIVAIGTGISSALDVIEENVPAPQRFAAVPFLRDYNENTLSLQPWATICVIGGGNSAVDAARAAKKYDSQNDVIISCIEPRDEMPAFEEEIESALAEGIQIMDGSDVDGCVAASGDKMRLTLRSLKEPKETWDIDCDYVITAVGQRGDKSVMGRAVVAMNEDDRILTDPESGYTKHKNVFAAGDICAGNHVSLIGAIASGKKAATGVRQLLEEYRWPYEGQQALDVLNSSDESGRRPPPFASAGSDEALIIGELRQFDIHQACARCDHCIENFGCPALIKVGGRVTVDEHECTRCGLCIDVCINNAIRWVDPIATEH